MFSLPELEAASRVVHESFPGTPQYTWPLLSARSGAEVWVKHENHTPTGAFKLRGGLIYAERLKRERPEVTGIISATRGNHGQSLAWAGRRYGLSVTIVVPHGNSSEKNAAMRAFGAALIEHGVDFEAAREEAVRLAEERGWSSLLRSRPIWSRESRHTRWSCFGVWAISMRFMSRLGWDLGYAGQFSRGICWGRAPRSSGCKAAARIVTLGRWRWVKSWC